MKDDKRYCITEEQLAKLNRPWLLALWPPAVGFAIGLATYALYRYLTSV